MRLLDPQRSYAVLIGTSAYRSPELADLPAVRNNLTALAEVLIDPAYGGLPAERCIVLPDPSDVRAVYRAVRRYATEAEDTLLVYFAGHGRTGLRNELYLSLADTDPDELRVSALAFDLVREIFEDSPAANRVLILDCCFSGRAIADMSGPDEAILGQIGIEGTYTLTSTPDNAVALAPVGATYTAFTGELLTVLRTGLPGGPELLTLAAVYPRLLQVMTTLGLPLPKQRGTGTIAQLALTRNHAHHRDGPAPSPAPDEPRRRRADTADGRHPRHGPTIQGGGLHAHGRKSALVPLFLGQVLGLAILVAITALVFLGIASLRDLESDGSSGLPWFVNVVVGGLVSLNLVGLGVVLLSVRPFLRPYELEVGLRGIELTYAGRYSQFRWDEVSKVTVRRALGQRGRAIVVYPRPGAPLPPLSDTLRVNLPRREKAPGAWTAKPTGWLVIAPVKAFDVAGEEIEMALGQFAGFRWEPHR